MCTVLVSTSLDGRTDRMNLGEEKGQENSLSD